MADDKTGLGTHSDIFEYKPNWAQAQDFSFHVAHKIFGFPGTIHKMFNFDSGGVSPVVMKFGYSAMEKEDEFNLLSFFADSNGRHEAFWCPSFSNDFSLVSNASLGATYLEVAPNHFFDETLGTNNERIYIEKTNGDVITRQITDADDVGDVTRLDLDTVLAAALDISDVLLFSRMYLVRFGDDRFDIKSINHHVGDVTLNFVECNREMD